MKNSLFLVILHIALGIWRAYQPQNNKMRTTNLCTILFLEALDTYQPQNNVPGGAH